MLNAFLIETDTIFAVHNHQIRIQIRVADTTALIPGCILASVVLWKSVSFYENRTRHNEVGWVSTMIKWRKTGRGRCLDQPTTVVRQSTLLTYFSRPTFFTWVAWKNNLFVVVVVVFPCLFLFCFFFFLSFFFVLSLLFSVVRRGFLCCKFL